VGRRDISKF